MKKRNISAFIALVACFVGVTTQAEGFSDMFKPATQQPYYLHNLADECHRPKLRSKRCPLPERFDAHNIDPYAKDASGRTVLEIARQRYAETGHEYCKRYAEEFEKYAQRYEQKKEQEQK